MIPAGLLSFGTFGAPAPDSALAGLAEALACAIPDEYASLLRQADGFLLENGTKLYAAAEAAERNATFEVATYAPGYIAVGDDSGGNAFLLGTAGNDTTLYAVGMGVMDTRYMHALAPSLAVWLQDELASQGKG